MISVILPAHNEESVIARCLRAVLDGARPGELEIIVACNGCTDRTAEIARGFGPPVRVIEVTTASKIAALNAADDAATGFPRFYIDSDVVLNLNSIREMARVLERGDICFATPSLKMDLSKTSWLVREFYRVWTRLPYNQTGGQVGTGVYALSREGRARFGRFPDIINDDGFVRFRYQTHERTTVQDAVSCVDPPMSLNGLIRAKTRVRVGRHELGARFPDSSVSDQAAAQPLWRWALLRPHLWPSLLVYVSVNLIVRRRASRQIRTGCYQWERDDSRMNESTSLAPS